MCVCLSVCVYMCISVCLYVGLYLCICMCVCVCAVYVHANMRVCLCAHMRSLLTLLFIPPVVCQSEDGVERIGNELKASNSGVDVAGAIFLVNDKILQNGVVFAFSAYFRTDKPVRFQLWRPLTSRSDETKFRLIAEYRVTPSIPGDKEDVSYLSLSLSLSPSHTHTHTHTHKQTHTLSLSHSIYLSIYPSLSFSVSQRTIYIQCISMLDIASNLSEL